MALSVVQKSAPVNGTASSGYLNNSSSQAVTLGSTTTTGNMIVVAINVVASSGTANPVSAPTDNKSNSYGSAIVTAIATGSGFASVSTIYCCPNITGGASHAVTANFTKGVYGAFQIFEISGQATTTPQDQTGTNTANVVSGNTSYAVSTSTLSQANEIAIAALLYNPGSNTGTNPGAPWNAGYFIQDSAGNTVNSGAVYQIVSATTALTSTWTFANPGATVQEVAACIATFKATGGGGSAYVAGQSAMSFLGMQ